MIRIAMFVLTLIAVIVAITEAHSQSQEPATQRLQSKRAGPQARQLSEPPQAKPQPLQPAFGGTWQTATAAPVGLLNNPLLLTDGTVIALIDGTSNWYRLTPDAFGNYATGTWSQIASMPSGYEPLDFASAVLPDGRVLVEGGECNTPVTPCTQSVWSSLGAIYDPIANVWTAVSPPSGPGWINSDPPGSCNGGIGDAPAIVLPNGIFMLAAACAFPNVDALFDAGTLSWTSTGAPPIRYLQGEQGYTLLQNGKVITIDVGDIPNAWAYDYTSGTWSSIAPTPVPLVDPVSCSTHEIGPAVTRPDGTVVAFGGVTSCSGAIADPTAIYSPSSDTWIQGPNLPAICGTSGTNFCTLADAPAALLPNGNILFAASAGFQTAPTHFFEFTSANAINQVADDVYYSSNISAYELNFLVLPSGQILATDYSSYVELYTPTGNPNPSWAPTVTSMPGCVAPGGSYVLHGTQLNGLSQGAAYGDDFQAATNYPLVRIVNNASGHVFYARTSGHSTMSIAPGQAGSTNFKVAANTEIGASTLYAVANGIPSAGTVVTVDRVCPNTHDFNGDGKSDIAWRDTSGNLALWLMNGAQVSSSGGLGVVPTSWSIVGQRDYNGDGKADLLWRDTSGSTALWFMNGATVASSAGLGVIPTTWKVVATADFNGDGKADILWQDTSGNLAMWLMNGATVSSSGGVGNVPSTWSIVGTADFDADGKTDLLWRDTSGNTAIWFMNGATVSSAGGLGNVPIAWSVAGTGDFNGDGYCDILWRDSSGNTAMWLMNGAAVSSSGGLGNVPTTWSVVHTGDYNGDGKADLLWRDTSGNTALWFMNGATVASSVGLGNIPIAWTVQSANAE
jgi:hypothetical protein